MADAVLDHESVDHDLDGVLLLLGEFDVVGQLLHFAVNQRSCVAVAPQEFKQILELALTPTDDRRENLESCALRILQQRVHHLLRRLCADQRAAFRAMRNASAGKQQSQIIVNLGNRADSRTWIAVRGLLIDRHRRAQTFDEIDVGLVHLPQELPCVRRQRLHISALAFGE